MASDGSTFLSRLWLAFVACARPHRAALSTVDARTTGALALLARLQIEGRLLDLVHEDLAQYTDEEVGAAARVAIGSVRKALLAQFRIERVRSEPEGTEIEVSDEMPDVRITGDVDRARPCTGLLVHGGWRVGSTIIVPCEVQL